MKGITVKQPGGADMLQVTTHDIPNISANEILVKVETAAVNRTDIIQRETDLGYMTNNILGVEVAGTVEQIHEDTNTSLKVGDRIMGLVNGGAYAEYVAMPAERAITIPEELSFIDAAAIPEVFLTAYQTLFWIGQLKENETVLIHAGGSGVGTAAIQLAKQLVNATVITTAGSDEKLSFCKKLGADYLINYKKEDFSEQIASFTNNNGVDLILDFVGASYWEKNLASIAVDGRWVLIGILGGKNVSDIDLFELMKKRVQLTGTLLTPRSDSYKRDLTKDFSTDVLPLITNNKIHPVVDRVFALEDIKKAHEHMEVNINIGKIIIQVS
ncbi:MAG TPA: NAD(P)H-quinone oxidoreductase [Bacillota bacterium]|nr:NAD(P)H-quinone oxidoreductase [Bacillota bacterium]